MHDLQTIRQGGFCCTFSFASKPYREEFSGEGEPFRRYQVTKREIALERQCSELSRRLSLFRKVRSRTLKTDFALINSAQSCPARERRDPAFLSTLSQV